MASQEPLIEFLAGFSTCDVSDVLLDLKHPRGGCLPNISLWTPQRQTGETKIVGPAYTVQYVPKGTLERPLDREHYIDTVPEGAVIVISSPTTVNAVYGGLMTARAKVSHAVGTVVDGRIRDLQEHRDLAYPVFARDVGTAAPYEVVEVGGVDVPLHISADGQELTVNPGDYIIGDLNGVVCLPRELAKDAASLLGPRAEADHRIALEIQGGMKFGTACKKHRAVLPSPSDALIE